MDNNEYRSSRDERMERRMQHRERWMRRSRGGRVWTGVFILIIGVLLLCRQAGVLFPTWLFTWPVFLIGIGLWMGARHRFRGFGWAIPILIGGIFLADRLIDGWSLRRYIWPVIFIGIGLAFIFRRKRCCDDDRISTGEEFQQPALPGATDETVIGDRSERLDVTAVFGGVKKNVLTKNFKGGEIMTFMGGAEINLTQADFPDRIKIDCTNVFGGTKLILPPDWEVQSDIVAIFGGVDDKRPPASAAAPGKVLFLDGTCVFGGVEIRSYY